MNILIRLCFYLPAAYAWNYLGNTTPKEWRKEYIVNVIMLSTALKVDQTSRGYYVVKGKQEV